MHSHGHIYVESKHCWKRKKGYSIKPENLNLDEYKKILPQPVLPVTQLVKT